MSGGGLTGITRLLEISLVTGSGSIIWCTITSQVYSQRRRRTEEVQEEIGSRSSGEDELSEEDTFLVEVNLEDLEIRYFGREARIYYWLLDINCTESNIMFDWRESHKELRNFDLHGDGRVP